MSDISNWALPMPAPNPKVRAAKPTAAERKLAEPMVAPVPLLGAGTGPDTMTLRLKAESSALKAQEVVKEGISFLDQARAAVIQNDVIGSVIRRNMLDNFAREETPDPNYHLDPKALADMTEAEQELMSEAQNANHEARIRATIDVNREQQEAIAVHGIGRSLAASVVAGLPVGYVTGMMAMRGLQAARLGSAALAAEGRMGASVLSNLGENAGVNLVTTAAQDKFDPYVGASDYAIGVAMGSIGAPLTMHSAWVGRGVKDIEKQMLGIANTAGTEMMDVRLQAVKNLGPDAPDAALHKEAARLEAERIKTQTAGAGGPMGPERQLLPVDDTTTRTDVEPVVVPPAPPVPLPAPVKVEPKSAPTGKLPKELAGAKPRYNFADKAFTLEFTSDIDRAAYITAQAKPSKRDAEYLAYVMTSTGMTEAQVRAHGKAVSAAVKAQAKGAEAGAIKVPEVQREVEVAAEQRLPGDDSSMEGVVKAAEARYGNAVRPLWAMKSEVDIREGRLFAGGGDAHINTITKGDFKTLAEVEALPVGVTIAPHLKDNVRFTPARLAASALAKKYLPPDARIVLGSGTAFKDKNGKLVTNNGVIVGPRNTYVIGINEAHPSGSGGMLRTVAHEMGHAVFHSWGQHIPPAMLARMQEDHLDFVDLLSAGSPEAVSLRHSVTSNRRRDATLPKEAYSASFDEYTAEQFVKYIEQKALSKDEVLPKTVASMLRQMVESLMSLFKDAVSMGHLSPHDSFAEFFDAVLKRGLDQAEARAAVELESIPVGEVHMGDFSMPADQFINDIDAQKHGLALLPYDTTAQKAEANAMLHLYTKADAVAYKVDEKRLSTLMNTAAFQGAQSAANTMLRSQNPVVRMVAAELLESPSGAAGRRATASISKFMVEGKFLGNTLNEVQGLYAQWRKQQGIPIHDDFFGGAGWARFNREVASEIESRRAGGVRQPVAPAIREAADRLQLAYERIRAEQVSTKTLGWAALPENSVGYMPHKMHPERLRAMTVGQTKVLHSALTDQFIWIEGFDPTFADHLASKYIDQVQRKAMGGFSPPMGVHQVGAADIVEDALRAMGMSQAEIRDRMQRFMRGAANHTKKRLNLDLNAVHMVDGQPFRLMDVFETDQFALLRQQAQRVSGEVALAHQGVFGKPGLALLRRAMELGGDGEKARFEEIKAFDQVAAEFLGDAFGTHNKLVDRAMQVNSLSRLGGMGFTQLAEAINGVFHVGVGRSMSVMAGFSRLRNEIKELAAGKAVANPVIGSLEQYGGREFGTDAYKTVFPFDNPSLQHQTYGQETLAVGDRLLRGGGFLQGKLSLWRTIHSVQQRGFAEQAVRKAAQYLRDGGNDVALNDMGIDSNLLARLRADIGNIATFDGGKLTHFDITKAKDTQAAFEFTQAIHRGVSQIIQGTFIGERGAWAHDGFMRLLTQFRTFSLTSVEKQWARQVGNVGTYKALGIMMGAMSMAAPIYMARTYLASIGREDQQEYLEKQLSWAQISRATLNYVAMSGLSGDFLDATTALTGMGEVTGGRSGASSRFVGNMVAPSLGLVDDIWKGLQNTKEGTDPHELIKTLPFSRLPLLVPAINALGD